MPEKPLDEEYGKIVVVIIAAVAVMALIFFLTQPADRTGRATTTASVSGSLAVGENGAFELLGESYLVAFVDVASDGSNGKFIMNDHATSTLGVGEQFLYEDVTFAVDRFVKVEPSCTGPVGDPSCPQPFWVAEFTISQLPALPSTPPEPTSASYVKLESTLREGETHTFTIDSHDYEITLVFVGDDVTAKFMINGALSPMLSESEGYLFGPRLYLEANDILVNSRDGVVQFEVYDQWYAPTCVNLEAIQIGAIGADHVCCGGVATELPRCRSATTKPVEPTPLTCGDRYITCDGDKLISYPIGETDGPVVLPSDEKLPPDEKGGAS